MTDYEISTTNILEKFGILVDGTDEAIKDFGGLLSHLPAGEGIALAAEQGRRFGVRLISTPAFDAHNFINFMQGLGMQPHEIERFINNLIPLKV
ncbi:hypothetical protein ACT4XR_20380 (plasmid) [Acinetobacter baumannii]|uniref:hypothetical protein n=1 Tax=Acinetobacter baumannii TaxID=470 RepID=UPI0038914494